MTDAELLEHAAGVAHDAWWAAKKAAGFHPPEECSVASGCDRCHRDMRPYGDLAESAKELARVHVLGVHGVCAELIDRLRRVEVMAAEERETLRQIEAAMDAAGVPHAYLATWLPKAVAIVEAAKMVSDHGWDGDDGCVAALTIALAALDDEERDAEPPAWQERVELLTGIMEAVRVRAHAADDATSEHWPAEKWSDVCGLCRALVQAGALRKESP